MNHLREIEELKKELFDVNLRLVTEQNSEKRQKLLKLKEEIKRGLAIYVLAEYENNDYLKGSRK